MELDRDSVLFRAWRASNKVRHLTRQIRMHARTEPFRNIHKFSFVLNTGEAQHRAPKWRSCMTIEIRWCMRTGRHAAISRAPEMRIILSICYLCL